MTKKFKVNMHCASCSMNIDKTLAKIGVESVSNPSLKITKIKHVPENISEDDIIKAIKGIGYEAKRA